MIDNLIHNFALGIFAFWTDRTGKDFAGHVMKNDIQGVSQKNILKKVKSNIEKTLNFLNLIFKLAEGTITQLSTVKISFQKKSWF